jgi:hypothetical protein
MADVGASFHFDSVVFSVRGCFGECILELDGSIDTKILAPRNQTD